MASRWVRPILALVTWIISLKSLHRIRSHSAFSGSFVLFATPVIFCNFNPHGLYFLCLAFFFPQRFYLFFFRERRRKRWWETCVRETSISCLSHTPNWGPGPQPRCVPWLGIEPATFQFTGRCSIHWAMPARAFAGLFNIGLFQGFVPVPFFSFYRKFDLFSLLPSPPLGKDLWSLWFQLIPLPTGNTPLGSVVYWATPSEYLTSI